MMYSSAFLKKQLSVYSVTVYTPTLNVQLKFTKYTAQYSIQKKILIAEYM